MQWKPSFIHIYRKISEIYFYHLQKQKAHFEFDGSDMSQSDMISYKKSISEMLCKKTPKLFLQIVEQFQKNVPQHQTEKNNIIKTFQESGGISVCKG